MEKSVPLPPAVQTLLSGHPRHWRDFDYVYPVLSRRSGGISIGINLNPDQVCNFDCIYCQVNRAEKPKRRDVDENQLLQELSHLLDLSLGGEIFQATEFAGVPAPWRRVNDVAFSGDGEPTAYPNFHSLVSRVADLLKKRVSDSREASAKRSAPGTGQGVPDPIKIILITNASLLHRPGVQEGLRVLDENYGEVWAKLDAGTPAYYQLVNRSAVPFQRVLDNILACAKERPTVIQSLFMKINGRGPDSREIEAYARQLQNIIAAGGRIKLVQVYTVARQTAENYVTLLTNAELDAVAEHVRTILPAVPVEVFYGVSK